MFSVVHMTYLQTTNWLVNMTVQAVSESSLSCTTCPERPLQLLPVKVLYGLWQVVSNENFNYKATYRTVLTVPPQYICVFFFVVQLHCIIIYRFKTYLNHIIMKHYSQIFFQKQGVYKGSQVLPLLVAIPTYTSQDQGITGSYFTCILVLYIAKFSEVTYLYLDSGG